MTTVGTAVNNLVYSRKQLQTTGQLQPGGWKGGLRVESLHNAEKLAKGYFYWLVAGITDSQLGYGVKQPQPNNRYLAGLDSRWAQYMGCLYPYMREGRRMIGRPGWGHPQGLLCGNRYLSSRLQRRLTARLSPGVYRRLKTAGGWKQQR